MEHYYCVDCSTCGVIYGLFDSDEDAQQHAARSGHDADATDKPGRPSPLVHASRHGQLGPLPPPSMTCGGCGATQDVDSKGQMAAFEKSHEESCGPDVAFQFNGTMDEIPD